ncbi:protein of unknown function, might releated with protein TolR [Shewanella benthica]|uniref:Uncharacterized protein n=1 Tax=Shewanella benthica TaxID=43661 RepID=A0A330M0D6_9GAMM|nr:protein of unknown function, might releated with protein TolR [Shewanella benthica]
MSKNAQQKAIKDHKTSVRVTLNQIGEYMLRSVPSDPYMKTVI